MFFVFFVDSYRILNVPDRLETLELLASDTRTMTLVDLGFLAFTLNEPALASTPAASGSQVVPPSRERAMSTRAMLPVIDQVTL